jgi:uncharacterized protein
MLKQSVLILMLLIFAGFATGFQSRRQAHPRLQQPTADTALAAYRKNFWDHPPKPVGWTNDFEHIFSDSQQRALDKIIGAYEKRTTIEFCVVTLDTNCTDKNKFDALALHLANTWGVGQKEKNNGVTVAISKGYRRIRICNGYGISDVLSDEETETIMNRDFIPYFKKGHYFEATMVGVKSLMATLDEKYKK